MDSPKGRPWGKGSDADVYLESDPRKHKKGCRESEAGKGARKGYISE